MQLGIFAKTFPGNMPHAILKRAREAGYSCVQYNMACSGIGALPQEISDHVIADIQQASSETGVAIAAVSATYNMIDSDPVRLEAGRDAFKAIVRAAAKLDCPIVTLCTGSRDPSDQWRHHPDNQSSEALGDFHRELELLLPIAEQHNIKLGIEPESGNVINNAQAAHRLINDVASKHMGIVFDPANLFEAHNAYKRQLLIEEANALLGPHIIMAHAKDRKLDGSFAAPGKGAIDFKSFVTHLQQNGFDGPLVTHGLEAHEAEMTADYLDRLLG